MFLWSSSVRDDWEKGIMSWRPVLFVLLVSVSLFDLFELSRAQKSYIDRCLYGWSTEVYHDCICIFCMGKFQERDYSEYTSRFNQVFERDVFYISNHAADYVTDDVG